MKVLIVCSFNNNRISPFILDQTNVLKKSGILLDFFLVKGKGLKGYIKNLGNLKKKISVFQPDLIHAHYGLSGLLSNLQRKVPVVTTYHGSDINDPIVFIFSKLSILLSRFNIFISKAHLIIAGKKKSPNAIVLPCGVDIDLFKPLDKDFARKKFNFDLRERIILFSGSFNNPVKNPVLAKKAVALIEGARLIELKGYTRKEVALLMNAVDACLLTSHSEGSPQFVKEAMACNCPVVSLDVGDVREVVGNTAGCYISSNDAEVISSNLRNVFDLAIRTNGRERIENLRLSLSNVNSELINIYCKLISIQ